MLQFHDSEGIFLIILAVVLLLYSINKSIKKWNERKKDKLEKEYERKRLELERKKHLEYINSQEYKAEQVKKEKQRKARVEYESKYGVFEAGRSQAMKICSIWEFSVWMETLKILNILGEYSEDYIESVRYYYKYETNTGVSSKYVWEEIDFQCAIIKEITGVQLRTREEIWNFAKNDLSKYAEINKLKKSKVGELIEKSKKNNVSFIQKKAGVYLIVNKQTLDFYIGETQNLEFRKKTHFGDLTLSTHHSSLMQKHFNKYGKDVFDFYILEDTRIDDNNGTARKRIEDFYIKEYNPTYNTDMR
ncbi:MAG: GIY-YIG nuclease family protein [Bacteroidales bacterium]|nr:GIY-YIG nuclease family protein [Bacteroidales bacterium]